MKIGDKNFKDTNLIKGMASYINSLDIDEFICKKVECRVAKQGEFNSDFYDCLDCIIEFFGTDCKYKADNDVCVNADCEHCADFVSDEYCGKCYLKEIEKYGK